MSPTHPIRLLAATAMLAACGAGAPGAATPRADTPPRDAPAEWIEWRHARRESLAGEDGWLTLVGLHWLGAGETTLGSDPASGVVLPVDRSPARLGRIVVGTEGASFVPVPPGSVSHEGAPVTGEIPLRPDDPGPPTVLAHGSLRMHVIARGDRLGLRVKDREAPARASFSGVPVFDYDPLLRVRGRFEPAREGETLPITNVLGMQSDEPLAGTLRFELDGAAHALLATAEEDDRLFVMFRDATTDEGETYGGGRYLEVRAPAADGTITIDFNYAYTPPCAFTPHATCPLPPPENELTVAIRAGERDPSAH